MSFASPNILPWLWLVLVLAGWLWLYRLWQQRTLRTWADVRFLRKWHIFRPTWQTAGGDLCLCLTVLFLLLALARPQWGVSTKTAERRGLDLVAILDVSPSMLLQDLPPSRWHQAVFGIHSLAQQLHGDRMALVAFGEEAGLQAPFTDDITALRELAWHTRPGLLSQPGQGLASALSLAQQLLQKRRQEHHDRVVLVWSDGDDQHTSAALQVASQLQQQRIRLVVIGVGHTHPPTSNTPTTPSNRKESEGADASASTNTIVIPPWTPPSWRSLQQIASAAQGIFWRITDLGPELRPLAQYIQSLHRTERQQQQQQQPQDRYPWAIALALLFLTIHRWLQP